MSDNKTIVKWKEYHVGADQMRDHLNDVSPSFCLAKWMMVSMHLTNGKTQSCYHPPAHDIPLEELGTNPGALHNTPTKIEERQQMRRGERPSGCNYCWRIEDAPGGGGKGHLSDRHYRSSEWWIAGELDNVKQGDVDFDSNVTPPYVEVNFNQACNFKCIYCSPHLSTEWEEEIKKFGAFELTDRVHNNLEALTQSGLMPLRVANRDNPYVKAFWEWWPTVYPNLRVFRMTGGEPLMDSNTWKVLDYALENPNADLELSITSNLCPPKPELFDKFIGKAQDLEKIQIWEDPAKFNHYSGNHWYVSPAIKYFMLFVSCDSVGPQAEYIRTGMDFDVLKNNVTKFLDNTHGTSVSFINTFNILSLPRLKDFLQWILDLRERYSYDNQQDVSIAIPNNGDHEHPPFKRDKRQRIWFDIPILNNPAWLSIRLLAGTEWVNYVQECIKFMEDNVQKDDYDTSFRGFKPYEILKLKRDLAVMRQQYTAQEKLVNQTRFVEFVNELDRRRDTNFNNTFPELVEYYDQWSK